MKFFHRTEETSVTQTYPSDYVDYLNRIPKVKIIKIHR